MPFLYHVYTIILRALQIEYMLNVHTSVSESFSSTVLEYQACASELYGCDVETLHTIIRATVTMNIITVIVIRR